MYDKNGNYKLRTTKWFLKPPFGPTVRKIVTQQNPYPPATQSTPGYEEEKTIRNAPEINATTMKTASKLCIYGLMVTVMQCNLQCNM